MFAAIVLVPTAVIGSGGSTPDYVVAIATLFVAALFRPLHGRTQRIIDRRFNRARYDAQRILEEWKARVREQTNLPTLQRDLVGVVERTIQPTHASIWMTSDRR